MQSWHQELSEPPHRRPITSTVRGGSTEVEVGLANGIDAGSVISCDNIVTIPAEPLIKHVGYLLPTQESSLAAAVIAAFDLDVPMPRN